MAFTWIMIAIVVLLVLFGIIAVVLAGKNKGKKRSTDYYALFTMGIIWLPFGIIMWLIDRDSSLGMIFIILGAVLIWKDKKSIGPVELIMLCIFLLAVLFLFIVGLPEIKVANLTTFNSSNLFIPYGVILFSLWGASIVPEIKEELRGDGKKVKKIISTGIVICVAVYIMFSLLVIGVSGPDTTQDAISGLEGGLGRWALAIGYIFGIIATFTSFITLGLTVKKLFWFDYGLPKKLGWVLACFIPLGLFIAGLRSFIDVIGLTGAVMLGMDGILVVLIYLKLKKKESYPKLPKLRILGGTLMVLLAIGVLLEIFYFFKGF